MPLETVLATRRSVRAYAARPLPLEAVSSLLWAAQGITSPEGFRTAPSAGGLYPLVVYLAAREVDGLERAVYRYDPAAHTLVPVKRPFSPRALSKAALGQAWVEEAPAVIVVAGSVEITARKYGERATQYVLIEVGHAAQNVLLEATALGVGSVPVGAFFEEEVRGALGIGEWPFLLIPVGYPRGS